MRKTVWLAGVLLGAASCLGADEKAYRAGIGLANKGANEAAIVELQKYLGSDTPGANVATAQYTLGVCLARVGKYADAGRALDRVVELADFAFRSDARLLRAQCASAMGQDAEAAAMLRKLLKETPSFERLDQAALLYAESQYRAGKYAAVRNATQDFASRWPASELKDRAEYIGALAQLGGGDPAGAEARLTELAKRSGDGPLAGGVSLALAQCAEARGDAVSARAAFERAVSVGDATVKLEAGLGAARTARNAGDVASARAALAKLDGGAWTPEQRTQIDLERGALMLREGKVAEAVGAFEKIAREGPANSRVLAAYWKAKADLQAGNAKAAAKALESLSGEAGAQALLPEILFDRAVALSQAGDDSGALALWKEWGGKFGGNRLAPAAALAEAGCLYRLGKYDECGALCEGLIEKGGARRGEAMLLLAESRFFQERYAEALAGYSAIAGAGENGARRAEVRRGLCLLKLQRADEAASALQKALESSQGELEPALQAAALSALGEMAFATEDWASAEKWFARAGSVSGSGLAPDAQVRLGVAMAKQGRGGEALVVLEKAATGASGTPMANFASFEYAKVLSASGRGAEAMKLLEQVARSEKGSALGTAAIRQLASVASETGDAKKAAELLTTLPASEAGQGLLLEQAGAWLAAGEYAKAAEACETFLSSKPKGKPAATARARHAIAMNRLGKHEDAIRELKALEPKMALLDADVACGAVYEWALALRSLDRKDEAAEAYQRVLDGPGLTPVIEAYAALDLCQIRLSGGKSEGTAGLLDRTKAATDKLSASQAGPVRERELYLRGLVLLADGKASDAAAALALFLKQWPESAIAPSVRLSLADAYAKSGRLKEASDALAQAASDPKAGAEKAVVLLKLGESAAASGQWEQSEKAYGQYLETNGQDALWFKARFGQGWAMENQGRHAEAIKAYADVVERHEGPTAARAQFQIGECLYAQKKLGEAVAEFLKVDVLYAYPEWSAAALYEAGRCLREQGKGAEASRQFADVVKRFPETRWAALAKEMQTASAETAGGVPGGR